MIWDHWAMRRRVESTSGSKDGWGLLYRPKSAKAVTRREPPFGFFTRKEGFRYSTVIPTSSGRWKRPSCSKWSNFSWSSTSLSRAYWGRRPFRCEVWQGPCSPLLGKGLRIHWNLGTEGQTRSRTYWAEIGSWFWQPQGECGLGLPGRMRSD